VGVNGIKPNKTKKKRKIESREIDWGIPYQTYGNCFIPPLHAEKEAIRIYTLYMYGESNRRREKGKTKKLRRVANYSVTRVGRKKKIKKSSPSFVLFFVSSWMGRLNRSRHRLISPSRKKRGENRVMTIEGWGGGRYKHKQELGMKEKIRGG
jgi:hypothetical protein